MKAYAQCYSRIGMKRCAWPLLRGAAPPPGVRAIGRALIRHYGLHRGALRADPDQRAIQEGQSAGRTVAGRYFGLGEPRMVVEGDMGVLPAGPRGPRVIPSRWTRSPTCQQRPGFVVSKCSSASGRARSERMTGSRENRGRRERPSHRRALPMVEASRPSSTPIMSGLAPLCSRVARDMALSAALMRRGCRCAVDGHSRSPC